MGGILPCPWHRGELATLNYGERTVLNFEGLYVSVYHFPVAVHTIWCFVHPHFHYRSNYLVWLWRQGCGAAPVFRLAKAVCSESGVRSLQLLSSISGTFQTMNESYQHGDGSLLSLWACNAMQGLPGATGAALRHWLFTKSAKMSLLLLNKLQDDSQECWQQCHSQVYPYRFSFSCQCTQHCLKASVKCITVFFLRPSMRFKWHKIGIPSVLFGISSGQNRTLQAEGIQSVFRECRNEQRLWGRCLCKDWVRGICPTEVCNSLYCHNLLMPLVCSKYSHWSWVCTKYDISKEITSQN